MTAPTLPAVGTRVQAREGQFKGQEGSVEGLNTDFSQNRVDVLIDDGPSVAYEAAQLDVICTHDHVEDRGPMKSFIQWEGESREQVADDEVGRCTGCDFYVERPRGSDGPWIPFQRAVPEPEGR
jgi:hypothetical protein